MSNSHEYQRIRDEDLDEGNWILYSVQFSPQELGRILDETLLELGKFWFRFEVREWGIMPYIPSGRRPLTDQEHILLDRVNFIDNAFSLYGEHPHIFWRGLKTLLTEINLLAHSEKGINGELSRVLAELLLVPEIHPILTPSLRELLIDVDAKVNVLLPA